MTQDQALKILKTGANVFLTGEPGSGKTYTINRYVEYLRNHGIEPAITASTGIAATHIGGMTIHSWSGIGIKDRLSRGEIRIIATKEKIAKRISKAKVLIIDEISMLAPNTLDNISAICREVRGNDSAFGGLQVVLVGDFFQLPPVVKRVANSEDQSLFFEEFDARFAYDSAVWREADFSVCYITEQFRQKQGDLLEILSKIRKNVFDSISMQHISGRKININNLPQNVPKLYSHNLDVDSVNHNMLKKIPGTEYLFEMKTKGPRKLVDAMKKGCLSPEKLYLKVGATVMFTKNNPKGKFVNGTLGEVVDFDKESGLPIVRTKDGIKITADYADWNIEEDGKIRGSLSQIPLRLAWALTVHKSQGVSLDEAIMDLSKVFEFGQGYVALSRVRSLKGLHLLGWNEMAFKVDSEVLQKDNEFRSLSLQAEMFLNNIAAKKLTELEQNFILQCGGSLKKKESVSKKFDSSNTYDATLELWKSGKSISQIAASRGLTENTILSHVEKLVEEKEINPSEILKIIPKILLPELREIVKVFKKLDTSKLSPVYEYFKGRYSYSELKMARIILSSNK